jgi:hypothetical protein
MKVTIIGILIKEGVSMKSGSAKPYSIGEIYTLVPFSDRDNGAKGFSSMPRQVNVDVLKKIEHLAFPLEAELETRDVISYGKPQLEVTEIKPFARASVVQKVA